MSFDWKGMIGKVAPWIAGALGGPAAGVAVGALCNAVGLEPTPENAQKAAQMIAANQLTGEQFVALQKAEADTQVKLQELGFKTLVDLEQIAANDRANAREREIKASDSWTPRLLAAFVVLSWIGINVFLVRNSMLNGSSQSHLDSNMEPMLMRILGTLDSALGFVLGYYFGSSHGSDKLKDMIRVKAES